MRQALGGRVNPVRRQGFSLQNQGRKTVSRRSKGRDEQGSIGLLALAIVISGIDVPGTGADERERGGKTVVLIKTHSIGQSNRPQSGSGIVEDSRRR